MEESVRDWEGVEESVRDGGCGGEGEIGGCGEMGGCGGGGMQGEVRYVVVGCILKWFPLTQ